MAHHRRGDRNGPPVPCGPMHYPCDIVMSPNDAVCINHVLYPPVVVRIVLPNTLEYSCIIAQPLCVNADNHILDRLQGNFFHQGIAINDEIDYSTAAAGGSSSSANDESQYHHAVYFVFSNFAFTSTGRYRIRLKIELMDHEAHTYFLGDIETIEFDVGQRTVRPQRPNARQARLMDVLRQGGFQNI